MLAIIGGSGLTKLANLDVTHREVMRTPYGDPSGAVTFGQLGGQPVAFLARHGYGHTIPPHEVNYRANLWALHKIGASGVVSVASVGSIRADLKPGDIVIPHQLIDYTWGRKSTYHEGCGVAVRHVDFTDPYDPALRQQLIEAQDEQQRAESEISRVRGELSAANAVIDRAMTEYANDVRISRAYALQKALIEELTSLADADGGRGQYGRKFSVSTSLAAIVNSHGFIEILRTRRGMVS